MSTCRSCGAPIIWATVAKTGKRMPLDATPNPDSGNVLLHPDGTCRVVTNQSIRLAVDDVEAAGTWHTTHFATCPDADKHRRRT